MNFTQSFEEFTAKLGPMDLALYAGIGLVLWVLFKDKLSPVQKIAKDLLSSVNLGKKNTTTTVPVNNSFGNVPEDVFFDLVVSWKQTRDLAVKGGCQEAVKVADQMFPHLSPMVCGEKQNEATK